MEITVPDVLSFGMRYSPYKRGGDMLPLGIRKSTILLFDRRMRRVFTRLADYLWKCPISGSNPRLDQDYSTRTGTDSRAGKAAAGWPEDAIWGSGLASVSTEFTIPRPGDDRPDACRTAFRATPRPQECAA